MFLENKLKFGIILGAWICLLAGVSFANEVTFGPKIGVNISGYSGGNVGSQFSSRTTMVLGGFMNMPMSSNLSLQPEFLYIGKGGVANSEDSGSSSSSELVLDYLELPILVNLKVNKALFYTGPYVALNVKSTGKYSSFSSSFEMDVKQYLQELDYGWIFGAGYSIDKFTLDVRYEMGLQNIVKSGSGVQLYALNASVGYSF